MDLSKTERLQLKNLINNSDCENNTEHIRKIKHSVLIRDDIRKMDTFKNTFFTEIQNDNEKMLEKCKLECSFLFTNYTDIFNKIWKNEIDMTIMTKVLTILKMIEDDKIDQHEGSALVGKFLKELYIDSAIKCGENIDKKYNSSIVKNENKNISWKEYKKQYSFV